MACLFSHSPEDAGFAGRLAEKVYRLANLESSGKTAKNESIEDTEIDIATITTLWMADRQDRRLHANQQNLSKFVGESQEIRDGFLAMANLLTPNDLRVVYEMIGSLMSRGMGAKEPSQ